MFLSCSKLSKRIFITIKTYFYRYQNVSFGIMWITLVYGIFSSFFVNFFFIKFHSKYKVIKYYIYIYTRQNYQNVFFKDFHMTSNII